MPSHSLSRQAHCACRQSLAHPAWHAISHTLGFSSHPLAPFLSVKENPCLQAAAEELNTSERVGGAVPRRSSLWKRVKSPTYPRCASADVFAVNLPSYLPQTPQTSDSVFFLHDILCHTPIRLSRKPSDSGVTAVHGKLPMQFIG